MGGVNAINNLTFAYSFIIHFGPVLHTYNIHVCNEIEFWQLLHIFKHCQKHRIYLGLNKMYSCMQSCVVLIFSDKILSDWITIFCLVLNFRTNHSFFALLWYHTYKIITYFTILYHLHIQKFHILTLYRV